MLFAIEVVSTLENFRDPDGNQTRNILNTSLHDSNNWTIIGFALLMWLVYVVIAC